MPSRVLAVEIVGDAASAERAFKKASAGANAFERDVGKSERGALAASGAFKSLGRSIAFASTSFLGAAGLVAVMKSSVTAAEDLNVATERLRKVTDNLGLSYQAHAKEISKTLTAEEKLSAFTKQDLTDSLGKLIPATHNVALGLKDVSLAADVARSRHMDLQAATLLVVKAQEGQVGALKRMGIAIDPVKTATNALTDSHLHFTTATKAAAKAMDAHATGLKAIAALTSTYGGSAAAATTPTQRFHAEIHQLQVTIGQALLPEINKVLPKLTDWIQKMIDSGRVSRDVHTAVKDLGLAAHVAGQFFHYAKDAFNGFADIVGGNRHAIELLTAAFIAFKLKGVVALVQGVGTAVKSLAGLTTAEETAAAAGSGIGVAGALTAGLGLGVAAVAIGGISAASHTTGGQRVTGGTVFQDSSSGQWYYRADSANRGGSKPQKVSPAQVQALGGSTGAPGGTAGGADRGNHPGLQGAGSGTAVNNSYIASQAAKYGLDPAAVLGVASHEGLSGGIGDGGHAFGPFQLNDAGGVITGMFPGKSRAWIQAWAWSPAGVNWALQHMAASGAKGLKGRAAVDAIVHGFERPQNPSGDLAAGYSAVGGSSPSVASLLAQGTSKSKKHVIHRATGLALLPPGLANQILLAGGRGANALNPATGVAAHRQELALLEQAQDDLQKKLGAATGKQKTAIEHEIAAITVKMGLVHKEIVNGLKAETVALNSQIAKIKSSYSAQISAAKSNVGSAFSVVQQDALSLLHDKYAAPTASEAQLAKMQAEDTAKGLQDTLTQAQAAGDPAAVVAAQRAIDENNLAIKAAEERAAATAEETAKTRELNYALVAFGKGLQSGTTHIGDLDSILAPFGISIEQIPADQLANDMGDLQTAVQVLAAVMLAEAAALGHKGDSKDAQKIIDAWASTKNSAPTPGVPFGAHFMAAGGVGRVTSPTLFMAGEAGAEDFAFSGGGKSFGGDGMPDGDLILQVDGQTFARIAKKHLTRDALKGGQIRLNVKAR